MGVAVRPPAPAHRALAVRPAGPARCPAPPASGRPGTGSWTTCAPTPRTTALDVRTGVEVTRDRRPPTTAGSVRTSAGELRAERVVVATGYNNVAFVPDWPGELGREVVHSGAVPKRRAVTAAGGCWSSAPATPERRSRSTSSSTAPPPWRCRCGRRRRSCAATCSGSRASCSASRAPSAGRSRRRDRRDDSPGRAPGPRAVRPAGARPAVHRLPAAHEPADPRRRHRRRRCAPAVFGSCRRWQGFEPGRRAASPTARARSSTPWSRRPASGTGLAPLVGHLGRARRRRACRSCTAARSIPVRPGCTSSATASCSAGRSGRRESRRGSSRGRSARHAAGRRAP